LSNLFYGVFRSCMCRIFSIHFCIFHVVAEMLFLSLDACMNTFFKLFA
jgi:hypothetical protein